jgi:hypothetical protein
MAFTIKIKAKYLYLAKYIIRNESANLLPYVSYTKRWNTFGTLKAHSLQS